MSPTESASILKLGVPVIGVVDSNNDPKGVDYMIPGNDDSIRAIQLYVQGASAAVLEGKASMAPVRGGGEPLEAEEAQVEAAAPAAEPAEDSSADASAE